MLFKLLFAAALICGLALQVQAHGSIKPALGIVGGSNKPKPKPKREGNYLAFNRFPSITKCTRSEIIDLYSRGGLGSVIDIPQVSAGNHLSAATSGQLEPTASFKLKREIYSRAVRARAAHILRELEASM